MNAALTLKIALIQLCVGDDPDQNLPVTCDLIRQAAAGGARLVVTPEATNMIGGDRQWKDRILHPEAGDPALSALRQLAKELGIWLLIGSLSLKLDQTDDTRLANRSFLIAPDGAVAARYDKLHMFDVTISDNESYRESAAFKPGDRAVLGQGPAAVGMTICYDVRFPRLYRQLAQAGAKILTVPAAFNDTTGAAHWEVLLRARAIETGCFVLAPAQTGLHPAPHHPDARPRRSWGHSLVIDPWGKIIADAGTKVGFTLASLDLSAVDKARSRVPSLTHEREFLGP